jgi:hypothetical protein
MHHGQERVANGNKERKNKVMETILQDYITK